MDGYELTDRGKILIAIIVAVILILLSGILVFKTLAGNSPKSPDNYESEASGASPPSLVEPTPPEITKSPPPNGGGFNPPDATPPNGDEDPGGQAPQQPPENSQNNVDPSEGTLSFLFSPDQQNALNAEILSMFDAFLSSPKNTRDNIIMIEMPRVSDEDAEKLMAAVVNAFAVYNVGEQRLAFSTSAAEPSGGSFAVSLYYIRQQGK